MNAALPAGREKQLLAMLHQQSERRVQFKQIQLCRGLIEQKVHQGLN
jgi:hypothetical protein